MKILNDSFELRILVNGNKLREYGVDNKTYVEGRPAITYTIEFKNNGPRRVLFVPAVDGLSVLDGNPATHESNGYICDGYAAIQIPGWRTSHTHCQDFKFTEPQASYAGKTQSVANCGVIGGLVFNEKIKPAQNASVFSHTTPVVVIQPAYPNYQPWHPWWWNQPMCVGASPAWPYQMSSSCSASVSSTPDAAVCQFQASDPCGPVTSACNNFTEVTEYNLGTGAGHARESHVDLVQFEKGDLCATFDIFYTDRAGLEKAGVKLDKAPLAVGVRHPQSFSGFCQIPK
jgi:hypothetical protein